MQENKSQSAINVIERLKGLLKLRTDIELAEFLNIKPNTISTWKKRNSLDHNSIISICELYELNLNEVFLGRKKEREFSSKTPILTKELQFQYASGVDRDSLLDFAPKFEFPGVDNTNSLGFQVVSNNMFPLVDESSIVICERIPESNALEDNIVAVAVSKGKGIFLNRIHKGEFEGQFLLANDNDFYSDIVLDASEIDEIWKVTAVISYDINKESRFKYLNDSLRKIDKFLKNNQIKL